MNPETEPVRVAGIITTALSAVILVAVSFGWQITTDQVRGLVALPLALIPAIQLVGMVWSRARVSPTLPPRG